MKKFLLTVVLFCSATIILSAEAIKDKDFEQFFNNKFKESVCAVSFWITEHLVNDFGCGENGNQNIGGLLLFYSALDQDIKIIKQLSAKNKYKSGNKNNTWEVTYDNNEQHYMLSNNNAFCIFSKIKGEWKIIIAEVAG